MPTLVETFYLVSLVVLTLQFVCGKKVVILVDVFLLFLIYLLNLLWFKHNHVLLCLVIDVSTYLSAIYR